MDNRLMVFEHKKQAVVSSRTIAEKFDKRHPDVTEAIEKLITENSAVRFMFHKSHYETERGRVYKEYLMNRDGFSLLVMGFTGKGAIDWKVKYIQTFNAMESFIRERQSSEWLLTREHGKLVRRDETDAIQGLILMAREQGSAHSDKLYMTYSKLVNKVVGVEAGRRETASTRDLMLIAILEDMLSKTIAEEVANGTYYKTVYQKCKDKAYLFARLAYLQAA